MITIEEFKKGIIFEYKNNYDELFLLRGETIEHDYLVTRVILTFPFKSNFFRSHAFHGNEFYWLNKFHKIDSINHNEWFMNKLFEYWIE